MEKWKSNTNSTDPTTIQQGKKNNIKQLEINDFD
jgi:hypothetical protein